MTKKQQQHANDIAFQFAYLMAGKYQRGAKEHGGNLWEATPDWLLDQAIDEAIDQVVYLLTLKETLDT